MKNKVLTFFLSIVPGVGHLYLGLMTRGVQFLITFFSSIFFIVMTELGPLSILLPIIWFYSFFDALQHYQLIQNGIIEDKPLFIWNQGFVNQKWLAYVLIGLGGYLIMENGLNLFSRYFDWHYFYQFRTIFVALVFILIGMVLLRSSKNALTDKQPENKGEQLDEK